MSIVERRPDSGPSMLPISSEAVRDKGNSGDGKNHTSLGFLGLVSPAIVSGSMILAVEGAPRGVSVVYCLDGIPIWASNETKSSLNSEKGRTGKIYSLRSIPLGEHHLQATSTTPDGTVLSSDVIELHVVRTMNEDFSRALSDYALQPTVQQPLETILEHTSTPGAGLTQEESECRSKIAAMYLNFGIDLSLDYAEDQSTVLANLLPNEWAKPDYNEESPLSMQFSSDSPFYHSIPADWPRVKLPHGYLRTVQLNTNQGGDGIGYGIAIAQSNSPSATITSMWYNQADTRKTVSFRLPADWSHSIPSLTIGDRHMIFVDRPANTFVSLYKTTVDRRTDAPTALYASSLTSFNSLGDHGGSTATWFSELPLLIQPGEATSDGGTIRHAIGGPVSRPWAARTYPATARDYGVLKSTNSCTGRGMTNTGLVPYGGIIQLDPSLDLRQFKLSRPAFRILLAMQTYGYYVMDFGCADLDIYTAIPAHELDPYGGLYGSYRERAGVQAEVTKVITTSSLYVVPPLTKRPI